MSGHDTAHALGIVELAGVCSALRARNLAAFERLGAWVIDTPEPALQRLFAEACHRHAWHAELWAERAPVISGIEVHGAAVGSDDPEPELGQRAAWYAAELDDLTAGHTALECRVDDLLDPATARTLALVTADLVDLRRRLEAAIRT